EVEEVVRLFRREERAIDDNAVRHDGRQRVESLAAVVREAEAVEVLIGRERRAARALYVKLQIAEPVERVGAAAGRDASAVLRPERRVLNVPVLAVGGRQSGDREQSDGKEGCE